MTCHLSHLQPELHLAIIDLLTDQPWGKTALLRWSGTSTFYRSLLAPYVFQELPLRNTESSGASLNFIANSPYASYAREIYFKGAAPADGEEGFENTESVFPDVVRNVLSNLDRFTKLETVHIEFDFDSDEWPEGYFYVFQDTEDNEAVLDAEEREGWRALMAQTYEALAQNESPNFKGLNFKNVLPKEVSTFMSAEFRNLLNSIDKFEISFWGGDNGAGWCSNTLSGFRDFVQDLDQYFFNHLASVKSLVISAHEDGTMGGSSCQADLVIRDSKMPLLQSLHLENIIIAEDLSTFLLTHLDTLENLQLTSCHSTVEFNNHEWHWEQFFGSILKAKPKNLRNLVVEPRTWPYSLDYSDTDTSDEAQLVYKELEENPKLRLFSYAYISDKYGSLYGDREKTLASFKEGADRRAYDSLSQLVDANYSGMA